MAQQKATRALRRHRRAVAVGAAAVVVGAAIGAPSVLAAVIPGTPGNDVTVGPDTDNASNRFIQPAGVSAQQHLNNTEVLFGRLGHDLLVGRAGSDVLVAGEGNDILIGGPERNRKPGNDVALGDEGDDIALWSPGDQSETFVGDVGSDTQVVGRLQVGANGSPRLVTFAGRKVPRAQLDGESTYACRLVPVPASQGVGEQYVLRVYAGQQLSATVRLKDVERVACPSPQPNSAAVADLTRPAASFVTVSLSTIPGVLGAIVAPS